MADKNDLPTNPQIDAEVEAVIQVGLDEFDANFQAALAFFDATSEKRLAEASAFLQEASRHPRIPLLTVGALAAAARVVLQAKGGGNG